MKEYTLSSDEKTLLKWNDLTTKYIDMQKDSILSKVEIISEFAFLSCSELQTLVLPEGLTTINHGAFLGCCNLTQIVFYETLMQWEFSAFLDCDKLDLLSLPQKILETPIKKATDIPDKIIDKMILK